MQGDVMDPLLGAFPIHVSLIDDFCRVNCADTLPVARLCQVRLVMRNKMLKRLLHGYIL